MSKQGKTEMARATKMTRTNKIVQTHAPKVGHIRSNPLSEGAEFEFWGCNTGKRISSGPTAEAAVARAMRRGYTLAE